MVAAVSIALLAVFWALITLRTLHGAWTGHLFHAPCLTQIQPDPSTGKALPYRDKSNTSNTNTCTQATAAAAAGDGTTISMAAVEVLLREGSRGERGAEGDGEGGSQSCRQSSFTQRTKGADNAMELDPSSSGGVGGRGAGSGVELDPSSRGVVGSWQ